MPFDAAAAVNEYATGHAAETLGASLRELRRARGLSQQSLAVAARIDIATVRGLERGIGTVPTLLSVLSGLEGRFADQPAGDDLGRWIAGRRKAAGRGTRPPAH